VPLLAGAVERVEVPGAVVPAAAEERDDVPVRGRVDEDVPEQAELLVLVAGEVDRGHVVVGIADLAVVELSPPSAMTSWMATTFGLFRRPAVRTSLRTRSVSVVRSA
jgi:hypothetical protein